MKRQMLINQVKAEYARIADVEGREVYSARQFANMTPQGFYERLLGEVIEKIESGAFDGFTSGREIVDAVANNHDKWGISM